MDRAAARYARSHESYPVHTLEELRALFERAGFEMVRLASNETGEGATPSAPSLHGAKIMAEIVARAT